MIKHILLPTLLLISCLSYSQQIEKDVKEQTDINKLKLVINQSGEKLVKGQNQNVAALLSAFIGSALVYQSVKKDNKNLLMFSYVSYGFAGGFSISAFYTKRKAYKKLRDF